MDITRLLEEYANAEPKRAAGGLHALAGFDFQLRLYVARLAEALASGGAELERAGEIFVEALSDLAVREAGALVCVQAKLTLTRNALKSAASEIVAIEKFLGAQYPAERQQFKFQLVASQGEAGLTWADLPANTPERFELEALASEGRLFQPRIEPDPAWRAMVAVWKDLEDPYDFVRYALDRALRRKPSGEDARQVRDDICERYVRGRRRLPLPGQLLRPQDFDPSGQLSPRLDIGQEATLARVRDCQYMLRESRRDALYAVVEERFDLSRRDLQSAARVFWLSGRSGVGKSVLLLQVVERLVREGRRVLWLGGAAENLEPAMRALAEQAEELRPEFIAVDDLYDRDARTRLDIAGLGGFIDEAGPRPWPVILTCGPAEFAQDFRDASRYRGFEVHPETVSTVAFDESLRLANWYRGRTGEAPHLAPRSPEARAFAQTREREGGLFISLAVELQYGDLKTFAGRFAERIELNGLEQALRLPLALNRLYLRAPYEWLREEDREKLATLNAEGDFSLLDPGAADQVVRLTHPHLGNALYLALRKPGNATAYAHDLRDTFVRALDEGRTGMVTQLLRVFSATLEGDLRERVDKADGALLARSCAEAWRDKGTLRATVLAGDANVAADVATSWACWAVQQPAIAEVLGPDLLSEAVTGLDEAPAGWPFCWQRLWEPFPGDARLLDWAAAHLPDLSRMAHPAWSFVWEDALASGREAKRWQAVAIAWLERPRLRPDWHYVWKKLLPAQVADWSAEPLLTLGEQRLEKEADGADWAYVLEDLLALSASSPEAAPRLATLGWNWLQDREDRAEWSYVWRALLPHRADLPNDVTLADLLKRGWNWLQDREDRAEWSYVWRALLPHRADLPDDVTLADLLKRGWDWLEGREDRAEWAHVWQALLAHRAGLPEDVMLADLLKRGWDWLEGREDREEWNYVWQALLARRADLPEDVTLADLLKRGWDWLEGRENQDGWSHVWQDLLARRANLPEDVTLADSLKRGWDWLEGREDREEWNYVWQALLANRTDLPACVTLADLLKRGRDWLEGREDRPEWSHVWAHMRRHPRPEGADWDESGLRRLAWNRLEVRKQAGDWPVIWWELAHETGLTPMEMSYLTVLGIARLAQPGHLERPETGRLVEGLLDLGCRDSEFQDLAGEWLVKAEQERSWPIIAGKFVFAAPLAPASSTLADTLTEMIAERPNLVLWHKLDGHAPSQRSDLPDTVGRLLSALDSRSNHPGWSLAEKLEEEANAVPGKIVSVKPDFYSVELEIGLVGRLPRQIGARMEKGDPVTVFIREVAPRTGLVGLQLTPSDGQDLGIGSVHEGIVTGAQTYGLFVHIGERQGLIHVHRLPDLAAFHAAHPDGATIRVRVVGYDSRHRLMLELEDGRLPDSQCAVESPTLEVGGEYEGRVTNILRYGLFVQVQGHSGLLHTSKFPKSLDFLARYPVGTPIRVRVLGQKPKGPELAFVPVPGGLDDPATWAKLSEGEELEGVVEKTMDYGLFIGLMGHYTGLLHRNALPPDLDFRAVFPKGTKIRVRVAKIEAERISLEPADADLQTPAD